MNQKQLWETTIQPENRAYAARYR
ncbi:hypothetical protein ACNKHL_22595 [Shigella flexneri]